MHGLEEEYWGRVDFVYLDRDNPDNREVLDSFGVRYQPEIILLEADGTLVRHWFGSAPVIHLRAEMDALLAGPGG